MMPAMAATTTAAPDSKKMIPRKNRSARRKASIAVNATSTTALFTLCCCCALRQSWAWSGSGAVPPATSTTAGSSRSARARVRRWRPELLSMVAINPAAYEPDGFQRRRRQQRLPFENDENEGRERVRRKYQRKSIPPTEKEAKDLRRERQSQYHQIMTNNDGTPSIWSFESFFPDTVWDEVSVHRDLYAVKERDAETKSQRREIIWRKPKLSSSRLPYDPPPSATAALRAASMAEKQAQRLASTQLAPPLLATSSGVTTTNVTTTTAFAGPIDRKLTRMVEDRIFGYRRTTHGVEYDTSLLGDGAVQFREGVRLGNPLRVNADRLNLFAKRDLAHGKIEEASELYERALALDSRDGRAYLGLSRCAERRRDFELARVWLQAGINQSVSVGPNSTPDRGANPFLLQALGCLEENAGRLSAAEALYIAAARSRPSHAAAWVSLARLRTRKLGQNASAGRSCYQAAERELRRSGLPQSAHVYTAWAALELREHDVRRARQLFQQALEIDSRSSATLLQLGMLERDCERYDVAEKMFETALKNDSRNSRILQAYALMESKRPNGSSRKTIDLFERALQANPRDAGVVQAYALYVDKLGDVDAARDLLRRGTEVNKRHTACWQAWGVLEMRAGQPEQARSIFQQGIWACAQLTGGQSGGYRCARLWQGWGVLEWQQDDFAAARRCFSRALDADARNVAAITAWATMEEKLGNVSDARSIFERALGQFAAGSVEKAALWRSYELMYRRVGEESAARKVFERAMREKMSVPDETDINAAATMRRATAAKDADDTAAALQPASKNDKEVEVIRWNSGSSSMQNEVWMNDKAIEGKLPFKMSNRRRSK